MGRLLVTVIGIEIPHVTVYNDPCISCNQNQSSRLYYLCHYMDSLEKSPKIDQYETWIS